MNIKIFLINAIILFSLFRENFCENEKTCEENDEYKILYDDCFLKEEGDKNFEFKLNEKIIEYIKNNRMITYPRNQFLGSFQGNFLHFISVIYNKHLPLYFTFDQILYPYIEITENIIQKIIEKGIYDIFYNFLKNILNYLNVNNKVYVQDLFIYFGIGFKLLEPNYKSKKDEQINKIIENILNFDKKENNASNTNDNYFNFVLFEYERTINKINFIKINPLCGTSINSKRLFHCITFFQNFIFNIRNELFIIYQIGEIISKSGQNETFKELKAYFKYIFNEEENILNPLEICEYINTHYPNKNKTKDELNFNLYYKIKDDIIKNRTFDFMSQFKFNNEKEETEFNYQIKSKISLFSYSYNIKDWINYKLLDMNKMRLFPSFYEYITLVHHGNKMKKLIRNRYNYMENKTEKNNKGKMIKFRDGINMEMEFNEVNNILNQSMINEKEKWENSYENSFNYLLNIIGCSNDKTEDKNNLWFESKIFNTLIGSYLHFKKDILLFEQTTLVSDGENGSLIDVYFEDNLEFYQEIKKLTLLFQEYSLKIINQIKSPEIKEELELYIKHQLNRLFISYENIIKAIKYQNELNKNNNEERNDIIKNLFYYNKEKKIYEGWYVDLYKINNDTEINYNLKIYAYNYHISKPIKELNFTGAMVYGAMNLPEFGVIGVKDKINKTIKLYILSFYSGNEYPHGLTDKIDFKSLKRLIIRGKI